MEHGRPFTVTVTSSTVVRGLIIVAIAALLFYLRDLVLIVLTAIVIASAIEPGVKWLISYRFPRILAVVSVYASVALMVIGSFYFFLPPLLNDLVNFLSTLPQYLDTAQAPLANNPLSPFINSSFTQNLSLSEIARGIEASYASATEGVFKTVSTVFGGLFSFILIVVFSFYFAILETSVDDFLRVIVPVKHQAAALSLWRRSQHKIGLWMQGQLLLALVVGVLVYLGLAILGVKYALILAFIAAVFELIPVFGPILAAIPAVIVAASGGTTLVLLVAGLYIIIQQFENHLIYPLVVTKVVGVPALLIILALLVGAKLAGFLGIILSVPAAAVIQELVRDLQQRRRSLSDAISS